MKFDSVNSEALTRGGGSILIALIVAAALLLQGCGASVDHKAIEGKVKEIERRLPEWVASGGNPDEVGRRVQRFQELMSSGRQHEAEVLLNEALTIVRAEPKGTPPIRTVAATQRPFDPKEVERKIKRVEELLPAWAASGGNPEEVQRRLRRFQDLMKAGKPREGEVVLDEVLELLEAEPQTTRRESKTTATQRTSDPKEVERKIKRVEQLLPAFAVSGGDPEEVQRRLRRFQDLMKAGKPREGEAVLDEVLELLEARPQTTHRESRTTAREPYISSPKSIQTRNIPSGAAIVFHKSSPTSKESGDEIFVMDQRGGNVTQITLDAPRRYEHIAVSRDGTKIAANQWVLGRDNNPKKSTVWVVDLQRGTETQLVPHFDSAGGGGIDWDSQGAVYFSGSAEPGMGRTHVYKVRPDGTGLTQLTSGETAVNAVDVGLSADGSLVAYLRLVIKNISGRSLPVYQVWLMNTDARNDRLVFDAPSTSSDQIDRRRGAADPTPSPDKRQVVFSLVNPKFKVYPNIPAFNTAHDLWIVNIDGTGLRRVTPEGSISIIPDWDNRGIVYTEISDRDNYNGISFINPDGTGKKRLGTGNMAKWIPRQ